MASDAVPDPLDLFSAPVRDWFRASFEAPTDAQARGWAAISAGQHTLIHAPTGSGKTLAAFLWCLDRLATAPPRPRPTQAAPGSVRVLYVSPLKALAYDVERNLRAPLAGIALAAERLGVPIPDITIASRTGDTPADDRRQLVRRPPDILVTTPESLYLLLTSQARDILRGVEHVIVDEVHAIAGTKRGAHLALSLERLERLRPEGAPPPQRIGLSATQRPLDLIARFLGGVGPGRDVAVVDAGSRKPLELQVIVPVEDMSAHRRADPARGATGRPGDRRRRAARASGRRSTRASSSSSGPTAARSSSPTADGSPSGSPSASTRPAGEELVRAHHGSIAREQRLAIEEELKAGRLPALVATSSLELGIDMGAVDLVVQVESPTSVASGLQRIGRAGHHVGAPSKGVVFPKFRGDLLEAAVVAERMHEGAIETTAIPRNPLDVLAQQLVAMTVMDRWTVDELHATVTRALPFETLSREVLEGVLSMLAGAYPSDEFAELKPRLVWDRLTGEVEGRRDARVVAVTSGGTIPDRGLYGVFMVGEAGTPGRRVGELDEEMVYESRAGEVITLGASAWRIEEITHDRVVVSPAPGQPGKLPFWHGDAVGRPVELGRAIGAFVGEMEADLARGSRGPPRGAAGGSASATTWTSWRPRTSLAYLEEERDIVGALPTDRRIVVERFRDELGRLAAHDADARSAVASTRPGRSPSRSASASGSARRSRPSGPTTASPSGCPRPTSTASRRCSSPTPTRSRTSSSAEVADSALFAARFRENAARALLLPRRRPGSRTPLWQQRQRAADLLAVASRYGSFPILVETYRECLSDVFDLAALREVLRRRAQPPRDRRPLGRDAPGVARSPSSLLFDYVAVYMYEGDAPLAERRAQALTLDRDLLRELLGQEELRELLDPEALADLELSLQALVDDRRATTVDQVHDLLRRLGDLSTRRGRGPGRGRCGGRRATWLAELAAGRRAVRDPDRRATSAGSPSRTSGGTATRSARRPPAGVPAAFLGPTSGALEGLLARWARTHGPFLAPDPAARWGLPLGDRRGGARAAHGRRIDPARRVPTGWRRSASGATRRSCGSLRRRSLARLRREVEPVGHAALGRFLPDWQGVAAVGRRRRRCARPRRSSASPRSSTSSRVCRSRHRCSSATCCPPGSPATSRGCSTSSGALGEVAWVGRGSLGRDDGRVALYRPGREMLRPAAAVGTGDRPVGRRPPRGDPRPPGSPRGVVLP